MGYALAAALVVLLGAHAVIVVRLGRGGATPGRSLLRAAAALLLPPLAPWWSWRGGHRRTAAIWVGAVALYALGVALTGR